MISAEHLSNKRKNELPKKKTSWHDIILNTVIKKLT